MSNFPKVIYLHDGQDDITWSRHEEIGGEKYINASSLVSKRFEHWARSAGFHDFETNESGCYEDDFLQHAYLGWEAAFICAIATNEQ